MSSGPIAPFLDALRDSRLLSSAQQEELSRQWTAPLADSRVLARHLLQRGWLTPYQVNQLFLGRGDELFLGSYVLLERLGEGGTGHVFKARHQKMQRDVALKVIRSELLNDPEVVRRFYREVQVLSQLSHPHVVHAYDAGPFGNTHFLVMEYVEGMDLSRQVKETGALPVAQACDYIRQAARGLAHAHEKGLVHRDIKPSNLLVTLAQGSQPAGLVKVLDLGLARLRQRAEGEITTALTPVGSASVTMGTPDYLAPEQALDFHQADFRADIYSLGCTFFFLLTGQPPFPGGSMAQKLMRHQQAEPPPLEQFRDDVPAALEALLRRMLSKRPEDRIQTAAEVADALTEADFSVGSPAAPSRCIDVKPPSRVAARFGKRRGWLLGGAAALTLFLAGLAALPRRPASPLPKPLPSRSMASLSRSLPAISSFRTTAPVPPSPPLPRDPLPLQWDYVLQGRATVRDAVIDQKKAAEPRGNQTKDNEICRQDQATAFLVRFDLAKAGLPSKARVEKARVSFYVWDPSSGGKTKVCAFSLRTPWDEATATWRQAAKGKPWKGGTNFALGEDTGPASPPVTVFPEKGRDTIVDPPIEYQLDVTAFVQDWLDGAANHGLAIAAVSDRAIDEGWQSRFQIYASEYPRVQFTPKLTVRLRP